MWLSFDEEFFNKFSTDVSWAIAYISSHPPIGTKSDPDWLSVDWNLGKAQFFFFLMDSPLRRRGVGCFGSTAKKKTLFLSFLFFKFVAV